MHQKINHFSSTAIYSLANALGPLKLDSTAPNNSHRTIKAENYFNEDEEDYNENSHEDSEDSKEDSDGQGCRSRKRKEKPPFSYIALIAMAISVSFPSRTHF